MCMHLDTCHLFTGVVAHDVWQRLSILLDTNIRKLSLKNQVAILLHACYTSRSIVHFIVESKAEEDISYTTQDVSAQIERHHLKMTAGHYSKMTL